MPSVQKYAKDKIVEELQNKIGTELGIGHLYFHPFNTIELDSVYLYDQSNEKILVADKISANIDVFALLSKRLVFNSAKLSNIDVHLYKETSDTTLNIQYIIDAFKSDNKEGSKSKLQLKISAVTISEGRFRYDVKDKPESQNFDANHIDINDLHVRLSLKSLIPDSLNIQIKKLSLKEKSGFKITNLTSRFITQDKKAFIRGFRLDLPNSFLQLDKCEVDLTNVNNIQNTKELLDNATFNCVITPSYISPKDVSAFVPALQYFKDLISIQTHISGSVDDIDIDDLVLTYGEKMQLISNFEIKDVRDTEKLYLLGSVDNFSITGKELENLLNNFSKDKTTTLPPGIQQLNMISFEGDISGYLTQLTAFGSFDSDLGTVKADILFGFNPQKHIASYLRGKVYTSDFMLGRLLQNDDLGDISLDLTVQYQQPKYGKAKGSLESTIYNFDYKDYKYSDISLNVDYDGLRLDGQMNINDENGSIDINGLFDLSDQKHPELNFVARAKNIQFDKLNISEKMKQSYLSFVVNANFTGQNIDDAEGYIKIDSLDFIRENKRFVMNQFLIQATGSSDDRKLTVKSDIINGEVSGKYSFTTMVNSVQETLHAYLPALVSDNESNKKGKKEELDVKENNLTFDLKINNTSALSDILSLPITVVSPAKIVGFYNNINDKFKVEVFTPAIKAAGMDIKSGYVLVENPNENIESKINALIKGKKDVMNDVTITSKLSNNLLDTQIEFLNDGAQKAKGNFFVSTLFSKYDKEPLTTDITIHPSELLLNNTFWKLANSQILIQNGIFSVNNFSISNTDTDQELKIDGRYSKTDPKEILKAELKNIDLHYVFETLAIEVLKFGGQASGKLLVSSIEGKPYANTRLDIADFKFNGTELGHLNLFSELDDETNKVMMNGKIRSKENKQTLVSGELDPIHQKLSFDFEADSLDISFLKTYTESLFSNISGRGSGKVRLFGNFSDVTVEGKALVENGNIGIKFLNTDYTFTDSVFLKNNLIYFNDITLIDRHNNKAQSSGKVAHDLFKNVRYYIDISADNFLMYNATETLNPIFSGTVFASGKGSISGDEQAIDISANVRTEDNTVFRMNFMKDRVNEYNFITYKDNKPKVDTINSQIQLLTQPIQTKSEMEINLNFYIDATPAAVAEIIMDPVSGDMLKGSGNGSMQFTWSTKSSPKLYGSYSINRGSYLFTFQRLMERKFIIEDGSSVHFNGDPFDATLDVNAVYKVTANLNDLGGDIAKRSGQTSIPVNCILNLTGPLKHPNIGLDINFPSADPEVERQIKVLMNSEDMINRQVAYLLILSKFYTPGHMENDYKTSDFAAIASATLSTQLTKIISQIDSRWQIGTNIRTSDSQMTSTEVELLLSSQLLNERLLINGNFGYRDDPSIQAVNQFIGDVDLEYLLNPSGTWRVKAYTHSNEKYYYIGAAVQTQGVGIKYKKDFDKMMELLRWKKKQMVIPKDSTTRVLPDSAKKGSSISSFVKIKE